MAEANMSSVPSLVVNVDPNGAYVSPAVAAADGSMPVAGNNGTSRASTSNPFPAFNVVTSLAAAAVTPQATTAAAGSLILKASGGNLFGINCVAGASAGFLMVFDSATVPADGAVTPKMVYPIAANAGLGLTFADPRRFNSGIVLVFSTTGPFTKTISGTAFLAGDSA